MLKLDGQRKEKQDAEIPVPGAPKPRETTVLTDAGHAFLVCWWLPCLLIYPSVSS